MSYFEETKTGIIYIINETEIAIDFTECNNNWNSYKKRKAGKNGSVFKTDNIIGQGDITSNPTFIEFFTKPFTKIELSEKDFRLLKKIIKEKNWNIIDLS